MAKKAFMIVGSYLAGLFSFFLVYKILALLLIFDPTDRPGIIAYILCGIETRKVLKFLDFSLADFNDATFSEVIKVTGSLAIFNALACASFAPIYILVALAFWIFYYASNGYVMDLTAFPAIFSWCEGIPLLLTGSFGIINDIGDISPYILEITVSGAAFCGSAWLSLIALVLDKQEGN